MTELAYFERLYRDDPDPWRLASAEYERRKRVLSLESLPRTRYRRGFEPACSTGLLTTLLAERCETLVASDPVGVAVERLRARGLDGVEASVGALPVDWPSGTFDLIVLSEILYFLDAGARAEACRRAAASLESGGHLLAVHWRHDFAEAASCPEESHVDLAPTGLRRVVLHEEPDFRLEVLEHA